MKAEEIIERIGRLDEEIAEQRDLFAQRPAGESAAALGSLFAAALSGTGPDDPAPLELVRAVDLAQLLPERAALLIAPCLEHESPEVRQLALGALAPLSEGGLDRLRPAIDWTLERGGEAAEEMIFLLSFLEGVDVTAQIERFLTVADPEMVVTAIEALADLGDERSLDPLRGLLDDERKIETDDGEPGPAGAESWTVGLIAAEAIEMIESDLELEV
ncbi:MAG: hypothetical protein R6V85_15795 [Polyangia bacterium]